MSTLLSDLLDRRPWLLADGATGTGLFAAGLEAGEAPEFWNIDQPGKIRALHRGFIEAGADIVLTNSFGGNAYRLKLHNAQDRVEELNHAAAALARAEADASGRPVVVAGSMGPTGELLAPVGALSLEDAVAGFAAQGRALMAGGADVLWAETMSSREEVTAAAQAAAQIGAPFCATLSFDTAGRTMMGVTSTDFAALARELPVRPLAYGANCGVGASDLLRTLLGLSAADPAAVLIAKSNAGVPKFVDGAVCYDGSPELMARYAVLARRAGARIIGGCCGAGFEHIRRMRAALEAMGQESGQVPGQEPGQEPGDRPSHEEIVAATGPFSSESDGAGEGPNPKRERRGRRRA